MSGASLVRLTVFLKRVLPDRDRKKYFKGHWKYSGALYLKLNQELFPELFLIGCQVEKPAPRIGLHQLAEKHRSLGISVR